MNFPVFLIIFFFIIVFILNLFSWLKPEVLLKILEFARPPAATQNEFQKDLWKFFDSPSYIWFLRFVFLIGLIAFGYFFLDYFILLK